MEPTPTTPVAPSRGLLIAVWLVVAIPALWGVSRTVQTSLNLFNPPPAATATQPASTSMPASRPG